MAYAQGAIVLVENPYADGLRPVMIVSNDERPYQGKQYTIAIVTTTYRDEAVRLEAGDITEGTINIFPSFVSPWSVHEFTKLGKTLIVPSVMSPASSRTASSRSVVVTIAIVYCFPW